MTATPATEHTIPLSLMPVAAGLAIFLLHCLVRIFFGTTSSSAPSARERLLKQQHSQSKPLSTGIWMLLAILTVIAYAFTVARVQGAYAKAEYYDFDPYAILGIDKSANDDEAFVTAELPAIFKQRVGQLAGHTAALKQLQLAYTALADARGKLNYERTGHPLGTIEVPAFCLEFPTWLLRPPAAVRFYVYAVYGMACVGYVLYFMYLVGQRQRQKKAKAEAAAEPLLDDSNSVSMRDFQFMGNQLCANLDKQDPYTVLWTLCATPANRAWSRRDLERVAAIRNERLLSSAGKDDTKQKDGELDFDAMVQEGGWGDDDDDDKESNKKDSKPATTDTNKPLLEGIDEGVLGQQWVERTLQAAQQWPPSPNPLWTDDDGTPLQSVLDHDGLRRMLCMTIGRLNSGMLNSHTELLQAGSQSRIDQTYFKSSMEFRQRTGLMLEAVLRLGMTLRNFKLVTTTLEAVLMFKIGCHNTTEAKKLFNSNMMRQYNCLPRLQVHSQTVSTPGEAQVATNDEAVFELDMERTHAEKFMKTKIAICEKQGIPPQVALQGFREGWWLLLRCERLDGPTPAYPIDEEVPFLQEVELEPNTLRTYLQEDPKYRLVTGSPVLVQNIAQKRGKFSIKFKAPAVAGKYKFIMSVRSQDYLSADQDVEVTTVVVDASTVKRTPKPKEEEPKKEK